MEEMSLSTAFGESLKEETVACISDFAEVGLDTIIDDGILKDIPIISTAIALYKIGNSINERHNLKKLTVFLKEINDRIIDEDKRLYYQKKFQNNDKFRDKEIEYLLVLIDRYINYNKPKILAKLYLSYLDEFITLEEFTAYAEILDRFLNSDYNSLMTISDTFITHNDSGAESILRLVALGLMTEVPNSYPFIESGRGGYAVTHDSMLKAQGKEKTYIKTDFGKKLTEILK